MQYTSQSHGAKSLESTSDDALSALGLRSAASARGCTLQATAFCLCNRCSSGELGLLLRSWRAGSIAIVYCIT